MFLILFNIHSEIVAPAVHHHPVHQNQSGKISEVPIPSRIGGGSPNRGERRSNFVSSLPSIARMILSFFF